MRIFYSSLTIICWLVAIGNQSLSADEFYVDATVGNDNANGTLAAPFKTINKAASLAHAGDTVWIRGGTYRETVVVQNSGTLEDPIIFSSYQNEKVVLSAADLITNWRRHRKGFKGNLWKAKVDWDAAGNAAGNTLFYDGRLRFEAGHHAENDRLDVNDWGQLIQGSLASGAKKVVLKDLRGFGDGFWEGAKITLQTLDWLFETRTITDYESKTGTVTFDKELGAVKLKQDNIYRIHSFIKALDRPGEWFKHNGKTVYFWVDQGTPDEHEIEFKKREYLFDVRSKEHIHIKGIHFRGAAILTDKKTNHNLFQNNYFYGFGRGNVGRFRVSGNDNLVRENEFSHVWGSALEVSGIANHIVNNYFHDIGFTPTAKVLNVSGDSMAINHNTFRRFARSVLDGYPVRSEVAYNLAEDGGRLSYDTGVFDSDGLRGNSSYTVFHHNIFRRCRSRGIMTTFYGRNNNAVLHHNLIYDWQPKKTDPVMRILGSQFCQVYHNTIIAEQGPNGVNPDGFSPNPETRVMTRYMNNLQISTSRIDDIGKDVRGNHNYRTSDFEKFSKNDFRLRARSKAIDVGVRLPGINDGFSGNGPDAGAIEFGQPMFKAGHDFSQRPVVNYKPEPFPGTNIFQNGNFSLGIDDWSIVSGKPICRDFNSWNLRGSSLTGYFRTQSVQLKPGDAIEKSFNGLKPNTEYTIGAAARLITELPPLTQSSQSQGNVSKGNYRRADFVTGFKKGTWIRLDNIDFGASGQYDQIEIVYTRRDRFKSFAGASAVIWLDKPQGQPLVRFDQLNDSESQIWLGRRVRLPKTTGKHSVYLSVEGSNSQNLALHRIRLVNSALENNDKLKFELRTEPNSKTLVAAPIGWTDWQEGFELHTFRTGSSVADVRLNVRNTGRIDAYLDRLLIVEGVVPSGQNLVAYGCQTVQSSTSGGQTADLGADGDGQTFSETLAEKKNAWWQVSVPTRVSFGRIVIVNRDDEKFNELSNFRVSVWSDERSKGGYRMWHKEYFRRKGSVEKGGRLIIDGDEISDELSIRLATAKGRIVRVELLGRNNAGNGRLSIADLELYTALAVKPENNAALAGRPSQSSNLYDSGRGLADLANNGIVNTEAEFTSTKNEKNAWWQVRLARPSEVAQVVLFNRTDAGERIGKFRVSLWNGPPGSGGREIWGQDYEYDAKADEYSVAGIASGGALIAVVSPEQVSNRRTNRRRSPDQSAAKSIGPASFVRIQKQGKGILSLSEVQVWEKGK